MANTSTTSQTGVGPSAPLPLVPVGKKWETGLYATVTGTATYTIEVTPDPLLDSGSAPAAARWFALSAASGLTANAALALPFPAKGVRVNVSAGTGTVALSAVPASL